MVLSELPNGHSAIISKVKGRGAFRRRIMEMGFIRGKEVLAVRNAPLKDPVQYSIMGYEVSLRRNEAAQIEILADGSGFTAENQGVPEPSFVKEGKNFNSKIPGKNIHIVFVGNPNCGKTSLFNLLSHSREKVGNYAGVTIESKKATIEHKGFELEFVDLPGTYSLSAYTPEERYVLNYILEQSPDIIVNVIDGSNLERNLFLTTQLIDLDQRVILALNMFDELEGKGDNLQYEMLGRLLGMPVVPTVGNRGRGMAELLETILRVYLDEDQFIRHIHIQYGEDLEGSLRTIQQPIKQPENYEFTDQISSRFIALRLLEDDPQIIELVGKLKNTDSLHQTVKWEQEKLKSLHHEDPEILITDARYGFISGALKETLKLGKETRRKRTDRIDSLLTHKYVGFPFFFLFLFVMFQATFSLGKIPVAWIEKGVAALSVYFYGLLEPGPLKDLIINGVIDGVGGVIVFLPNILILFLFIALMEDTGYMARAAFIMDRLMHAMGLHGRSFIPLIMGFGCNVPAIMATRTIENRNNRLLTMLINPFMSCSARLPVYVLFIGAFFPDNPGMILFLLYGTGIVLAIVVALIFKKLLFRSEDLPFVMELPPYRMPTLRALIIHMWNRGGQYLKKMGGVILIASIIIWALGNFPKPKEWSRNYSGLIKNAQDRMLVLENKGATKSTEYQNLYNELKQLELGQKEEEQEFSYIARIGRAIEPVLKPLGFDWRMSVSLLTGVAAKEIVVSTMGILFQADETEGSSESLTQKLQSASWQDGEKAGQPLFDSWSAISFLLFILIYFPCIAVLAAIRNESGSWGWAIFVLAYTTILAWLVSFSFYQISQFILRL